MLSGAQAHLKRALVHPELQLLLAACVVDAAGQGGGTEVGAMGKDSLQAQQPTQTWHIGGMRISSPVTGPGGFQRPLTWLHCTGCT